MNVYPAFHIELVPDVYAPALRVRFPRGAKLPRGFMPAKHRQTTQGALPLPPKNRTYLEWVRSLPQRRFEVHSGSWLITNPGADYRAVLEALGFPISEIPAHLLDEYDVPHVVLEPENDYLTFVYPRFADWHEIAESLPGRTLWGESSMRVYTPDFHFHPHGAALVVPSEILDLAERLANKCLPGFENDSSVISEVRAESTNAILSGHTFLADAPGNGRRIKALNAQLIRGAQRLVVVCRSKQIDRWMVAITVAQGEALSKKHAAWFQTDQMFTRFVEELKSEGLYEPMIQGKPGIVNLNAHPTDCLPINTHAVVVDVDTLSNHAEAAAALRAWQPDGIIVDNAEDFSVWENGKTAQIRKLANAVEGLRIPIADASKFSDPLQFMPLLAISGHLDPVFGGMTTYCTTVAENKRNGWVTRKDKLQWLVNALNENVWVRSASAAEIQFDEIF